MCLSDLLALEDLFAVGIGLDLAGAFLLARGLLVSPSDVADTAQAFVGGSHQRAWDQVNDRVDALIGLLSLGFGFSVQIVAHGLVLAIADRDRRGPGEGITAVVLAAVAFALVLSVWYFSRDHMRKRFAIRAASAHGSLNGALLQSFGECMGHKFEEHKHRDQAGYLKAVFDIDART